MSISNLFVPNDLDLFCGSITTSSGSDHIIGKLTITNNSASGTENIYVNQTNIATTANDITFASNGFPIFSVGENPSNNDSYCYAGHDFKIGTNFTERLRIPQAGILNNNSATNLLALVGTTLVYVNDIITPGSNPTFENLSLTNLSNNNTVLNILGIDGSDNVVFNNNLVDTNSTQTLTNKLLTGCEFNSAGHQVIIFDTSLVTGPRTWTAPNGNGIVIMDVLTQNIYNKTFDGSSQLIGTYIAGLYTGNVVTDYPINFDTSQLTAERTITWQDEAGTVVTNANTITLDNKYIDSSSNDISITNSPLVAVNINSLINQDVRSSASPTFFTNILSGNTITISNPKTPASSSDTGTQGQIAWDDNFIYVCIATNTWKRTAILTW
jgi:hypothetical protein